MFLHCRRLKNWWHAIGRFLCWTLILLKLIDPILRWSRIWKFVSCLLLIHFFFLHFLVLLGQTLLKSSFLHIPVIHEVEVESFADKRLSKHRYQLLIIRFLFKLQLSRIVQKVLKFFGVSSAQVLDARYCFLNLNLFIFLFLCFCWQALPRQRPSNEVHEDNTNLLQIISPRLLNA